MLVHVFLSWGILWWYYFDELLDLVTVEPWKGEAAYTSQKVTCFRSLTMPCLNAATMKERWERLSKCFWHWSDSTTKPWAPLAVNLIRRMASQAGSVDRDRYVMNEASRQDASALQGQAIQWSVSPHPRQPNWHSPAKQPTFLLRQSRSHEP